MVCACYIQGESVVNIHQQECMQEEGGQRLPEKITHAIVRGVSGSGTVAAGFQTKTKMNANVLLLGRMRVRTARLNLLPPRIRSLIRCARPLHCLRRAPVCTRCTRGGTKNVCGDAFKNHPTNFFRVMSHRVSLHTHPPPPPNQPSDTVTVTSCCPLP